MSSGGAVSILSAEESPLVVLTRLAGGEETLLEVLFASSGTVDILRKYEVRRKLQLGRVRSMAVGGGGLEEMVP